MPATVGHRLDSRGGVDPMRIAILGAGGVGGYYGGILARAGNDVVFLARGASLDALRARGLTVRSAGETFSVTVRAESSPRELPRCDLALVAVKGWALPEVLPAARLLAENGASVLPFLNGVEAADRLIAGGVERGRVLGGLTQISAARVAPGIVERRSGFARVTIGELSGGFSPRAEEIAALFREAGAEAAASADIVADLWRKLAFISSMAAACGLARAPVGPVRDAPYGKLLFSRLVEEVFAVARARGAAVGPQDAHETLRFIDALAPEMRPSFLLDLEAGGPNELDDLSGAVSRLGREAEVETPFHDTATAALSAATSARAGRRS